MNNTLEKKPLNQEIMKYILIFVMTLDHISYYLGEAHPLYLPFRFIARLTGPTMAYFLADGYYYTHDLKKYISRIFIFALISHFPYMLFEHNNLHMFSLVDGYVESEKFLFLSGINKTLIVRQTSVMFTLFLGLISIALWDKTKLPKWLKVILTLGILWVGMFADWHFIDILFCLNFYFFRDNKKAKWFGYTIICLIYMFDIIYGANPFNITIVPKFYLYRLGTLLVIPFVELLYNGKVGKKTFMNKWFFYIYYPLHFLVLYFIFNL